MAKVTFIGAGPGDPELITLKGIRAIEKADIIIYAGSLVPRSILEAHAGVSEDKWFNSASMDLDEIISVMQNAVKHGKSVARLHTGDPSIYGAIQEQLRELKARGIETEIIPGVSSAFAASASLKIEFTIPEQTQTVIFTRMAGKTPVPETETLESLAAHKSSLVIFLSAAMARAVQEKLLRFYSPETPVAIVYRVSWPDEKIIRCPLGKLADHMTEEDISKQALIIVSPGLVDERQTRLPDSRLYRKDFSHSRRKARK